MRNSKMKGFTLIELIVVIAIIGILAAILVPSMLGYVRNARISQANANAKQFHTAASSALTQLGIANVKLATAPNLDNGLAVLDIGGSNMSIVWGGVSDKVKEDVTDTKLDLASYLGEGVDGVARVYLNTSTYSVYCAIFEGMQGGTATDVGQEGGRATAIQHVCNTYLTYDQKTENNVTKYVFGNTCDADHQKADAKDGKLYGIYPQGTAANSGTNTNG